MFDLRHLWRRLKRRLRRQDGEKIKTVGGEGYSRGATTYKAEAEGTVVFPKDGKPWEVESTVILPKDSQLWGTVTVEVLYDKKGRFIGISPTEDKAKLN